MARVKKTNVTKLLFSLSLYFATSTLICDDQHDFDIINETVSKKESIKQPTKETNKPQKKKSKENSAEKKTREKKEYPKTVDYQKRLQLHEEKRTINNFHVIGNKVITKESIIQKLPLKVGDKFNVNYTAAMIKNLYKMGFFHQVKVYAEPIDNDGVDIHIVVQEKPRLKEITFSGNKAILTKDLKEELKVGSIPTLVKEELTALISKIKKYYHKKSYHDVEIEGKIIPEENDHVSAAFTIKEGKKSYLTRISFKGNKNVSSKKLKRIIFSKEDWLLGMLDKAGTYNAEMIEGDKAMIEDAYKSNGFVHAKVVKVDTEKNDKEHTYQLTYHIQEGDRYTISSIEAPGNDTISEDQLKLMIPLRVGQLYSLEKIRTALENLKTIWGEYGYIFADIDPIIDINEEDKTASIKFQSDLKDKVYLNRLTIKGNSKTRDKVIRRGLLLEEGELITNKKMEASKSRVGILNYFDQKDGVSWKTTRIDENNADLELILKEVKTGHMQMNIGYGGSPTNRQSPQTGLTASGSAGDRNLWGTGISASISAEIAAKYRAFNGALMNPFLFDKPISGSINGFIKKSEYENVDIAEHSPFETTVGGGFGVGYFSSKLNGILINGQLTYERITFDNDVKAAGRLGQDKATADLILKKNFQPGSQLSLIWNVGQDKRNGTMFITNGHQWRWNGQITFPGSRQCNDTDPRFNYFRSEFDTSWYTPLIGEYDLVLGVHANLGFIHRFKDKQVPWRALYHVGGPTTVRGYTYGQVGPTWKENSLGAKHAFNVNVEFTTPLSSDLNTRAVVFYDGGAGWNTPYFDEINKIDPNFTKNLTNNNFFYRHSVGIGVRMKSPSPVQVDFGIKLNPSKRFRKNLTEMHLTMDHAF